MVAAIRCGENSLAIYCLAVLLSFMGFVILSQFSCTLAVQVVISIVGIALMIAAATLMTWTFQTGPAWAKPVLRAQRQRTPQLS